MADKAAAKKDKDEDKSLAQLRDPSTAIPPDVMSRYLDPIPAGRPKQ
jgi:hypothetical protein